MAVLYRKYRPQTFAEVLGQKHIIQTLKNQVKSGSVAHAYLFTGSRGVGKTSVARILAKAVNCTGQATGNADACGKCDVCRQIEAGNFLDLVEIDAASNTGVDNIRDLIEHVKFSPSVGKYKVFIIDEVHMLSKGAFNALLKTLEEPPKHAIFVLATTEIGKVPATIVSRTQRFDFQKLSVPELSEHLKHVAKQEKLKFSDEILQLIAQRAEGGVRDALSLLDKLSTLGSSAELPEAQLLLGIVDVGYCQELLKLIAEGKIQAVPNFFAELFKAGIEPLVFNRDFLEYLRKILVLKVAGLVPDSSPEHARMAQELAGQLSLTQIILVIRLFLKSYKDIPTSPSPDIPLLLAGIEAAARPKNGAAETQAQTAAKPVQAKPSAAAAEAVSEFAFTQIIEPTAVLPAGATLEFSGLDESLTQQEVLAVWPALLESLKNINGPLANLVKNSPIEQVSEGVVTLGVKYLFHKQSLENPKNSKVILENLEKLLGKKVGVAAKVTKPAAAENTNAAEILSDALKIFGGEVVE